jgi:hypothetical protein
MRLLLLLSDLFDLDCSRTEAWRRIWAKHGARRFTGSYCEPLRVREFLRQLQKEN